MSRFLYINPDYHSVIHFLGCFFVAQCLVAVGLSILTSSLGSAAAGFIWECLDECNRRFAWNIKILDPAGFDVGDMIVDVLGALTGGFVAWRIIASG